MGGEGGFLVKFDGKDAFRCYFVAFDYDEWRYTANNDKPKPLPHVKNISVVVENDPLEAK